MKKLVFTLILISTLLLLVMAACTSSTPATQDQAPASDTGTSLVNERCSQCHSVNTVKAMNLTKDEWTQTVDRMIRKGANLNEEEKKLVIEYLDANY